MKRKIFIFFIIVVAFGSGVAFGLATGWGVLFSDIEPPQSAVLNLLWETHRELKARYLAPETLSDEKLFYGAIKGLVGAAGDPYTAFFTPEEARQFLEEARGHFDGIGAEIGFRNGILSIVAPLPSTPAEKAGLLAGDHILRIDGQSTDDMTLEEAVTRIRGNAGTKVTLQIFREEEKEPRDITILRARIDIPTLEISRDDERDIIIFQLSNFSEDAPSRFREMIPELTRHLPSGIILDLRNNPGGFLDAAVEIAGWFLAPNTPVVIERERGKENTVRLAQGSGILADIPTVVLINRGTASAAEILAGALRDNRDVLLVGEKTFGKGTIQEFPPLSGGAALKVTIGEWLTPNGTSLRESGLAPDKEITDNPDTEIDEILEAGKEALRQ